jgi:hypothetical protein
MKAKAKLNLSEKEVVRIWQNRLQEPRLMCDTEGQSLEVIYPGRLNDSRGGDFKDAVIASGPQLEYGCIEIHSRTSGWRVHGHQSDPHYNQVVLHVAMEQDTEGKTVRQDGVVVPTIILSRNAPPGSGSGRNGSLPPCRAGKRKGRVEEIRQALRQAGIRRLVQKAGRFSQELADADEGQSLYLGILEALGYNRNSQPFLELGRKFSLSMAERLIDAKNQKKSLLELQAVLLGTAGLLPSQRPADILPSQQAAGLLASRGRFQNIEQQYVYDLERIWAGRSVKINMSRHDWEFFRVRPGNYPVRRIIALSHLILRFQPRGWRQSWENLALGAQSALDFLALESALQVTANCFWAAHFDFASAWPDSCGGTLLGRQRAREIIVNVLLPYLHQMSETGKLKAPGYGICELYSHYPRLESNTIERHMLQQLSLNTRQVNTACLQQGLMLIYKQYCTLGRCAECVLSG